MADTGGIAALLKALNESPALGAGLKPGASVSNSAAIAKSSTFAAAAGIAKASGTGAATAARPIRAASSLNAAAAKPKLHIADGLSYRANAPRGTYLDVVV